MFFLAIDLGETTGVVLYDIAASKVAYSTEVADTDDDWFAFLAYISTTSRRHNVRFILEEMPYESGKLFNLRYAVISGYDITHLIKPANWKPFAKGNDWKPNFASKHVRDAYNMLRYYLLTVIGIDIGEYE